jgi:hypothetical protein
MFIVYNEHKEVDIMKQLSQVLIKIVFPLKNKSKNEILKTNKYLTIEEVIKRYEELSAL